MLTPAQILSSSRPTADRMATLATRNAARHTRAELERYAAASSGWVQEMWLTALVLHRANATCNIWGAKHKLVWQRHLSEACALYACRCGVERAWADVDADANGEHSEYVIIEAEEEAELLEALPSVEAR